MKIEKFLKKKIKKVYFLVDKCITIWYNVVENLTMEKQIFEFKDIYWEAVGKKTNVIRLLWDEYVPENVLRSSVSIYHDLRTGKIRLRYKLRERKEKTFRKEMEMRDFEHNRCIVCMGEIKYGDTVRTPLYVDKDASKTRNRLLYKIQAHKDKCYDEAITKILTFCNNEWGSL